MKINVNINEKLFDDICTFSIDIFGLTYNIEFNNRSSFLEASEYLKELEKLHANKLIVTLYMRTQKIIIRVFDESIFDCKLNFIKKEL